MKNTLKNKARKKKASKRKSHSKKDSWLLKLTFTMPDDWYQSADDMVDSFNMYRGPDVAWIGFEDGSAHCYKNEKNPHKKALCKHPRGEVVRDQFECVDYCAECGDKVCALKPPKIDRSKITPFLREGQQYSNRVRALRVGQSVNIEGILGPKELDGRRPFDVRAREGVPWKGILRTYVKSSPADKEGSTTIHCTVLSFLGSPNTGLMAVQAHDHDKHVSYVPCIAVDGPPQ